ncbi:MAG: hypothetical protein WCC57_19190 [Paracoccaceae bacterium]
MTQFTFSALANGQHLAFNVATDVLNFTGAGDTASAVQITVAGGNLGLTYAGRTVWLDGVSPARLALGNTTFLNTSTIAMGDNTINPRHDWYGQAYSYGGSTVGEYVNGLGGTDLVTTGSGNDVLVGNVAMGPLVHVSRMGVVGSPTLSSNPSISADGRFVAFEGGWTGFGSVNNNATDVLVRDLLGGGVSNENVNSLGVLGGSGAGSPMISADGHFVAFSSSSGLVGGSPPANTIYRSIVGSNAIQAVSVTAGGIFANGGSQAQDISADGRYVVFTTAATNFEGNADTGFFDVYRKDMATGDLIRITTSLTNGDANGVNSDARISADGRFIVFSSQATNLTQLETGSGRADIYVWDSATNDLTNITVGFGNNDASGSPDIAFDGGYGGTIVFESNKAFVAGDTNNTTDIYAYSLFDGSFTMVSTTATGAVVSGASEDPSISGDGRFVVFRSFSGSLVSGDTNGFADIFVKDLYTGAIALVSRTPVAQGNQTAEGSPEISLGGEWIVFGSTASNLATTDANGNLTDVFRVANPLLFDTLRGGLGNDTYILDRRDTVVENVNAGTDTIRASLNYTLGLNLENLVLTGTDHIAGAGNAANNVITGNAGHNVIDGLAGIDTASYATSTAAVTVNLMLVAAQVTGFGSDTLRNIENLYGSNLNDRLTGNSLANTLNGSLGNDTLIGSLGNDIYVTDSSGDVIVESAAVNGGIDTVLSSVNWTLQALLENLTLTGTAAINGAGNSADNVITGNGAANILAGNNGNDRISGGLGVDIINGGAGADTLTGGVGADAFVFNYAFGADIVTDFVSGSDKLRFQMSVMDIGDGDLVLEGAGLRAGAGGFSAAAELVIFTSNVAALSTAAAATAIGSATSAYAVGHNVLFAVDNGISTGIFRFSSANADGLVSAAELTLVATLQGTPTTAIADYLFVA